MNSLGTTAELLQLIGEPTRMRLLALLARRELSVAEIDTSNKKPPRNMATFTPVSSQPPFGA